MSGSRLFSKTLTISRVELSRLTAARLVGGEVSECLQSRSFSEHCESCSGTGKLQLSIHRRPLTRAGYSPAAPPTALHLHADTLQLLQSDRATALTVSILFLARLTGYLADRLV